MCFPVRIGFWLFSSFVSAFQFPKDKEHLCSNFLIVKSQLFTSRSWLKKKKKRCIYYASRIRTVIPGDQKMTLTHSTLLKVYFYRYARINWTEAGILLVFFNCHILSTEVRFEYTYLYVNFKCLVDGSPRRSLWMDLGRPITSKKSNIKCLLTYVYGIIIIFS